MSQQTEGTGAQDAQIRVEQTAGEVRGKMTGVEIHQFYGEIIVRPESIEDLPPAEGEPPYKGLTYYTEHDAEIFFGRERLTDRLVDRLQETRFLAVVGASGSGKSSLLRAGVVPAVRRQNWTIHILTPTADPLNSLATSLTRDDLAADTGALKQRLAEEPGALPQVAGKLAARANRNRLLLVVDQFEEAFTLCKEDDERRAFLACLEAAAAAESAASVLIGVRADFYDRCLQYEGLRRVLAEQQEPLGPMTEEELVRVIAEPAKRGGWQFMEGLVEQMLEDVGQEPGRLPLLSHALRETWEKRRGRVMTLAGYRAAGGVEGAIAETAENVLENVPEEQVRLVQNVFLSLTELGEGAEDTRRIADAGELARLGEEEEVAAVLERLVRARLVTVDEDQVEVAHEALIRRWPRLHEWLEDNRERLRFERQLARDAREWKRLEWDAGALYRGARLARAVAWWEEEGGEARHGERLDPLTEAFLEASRELAEREAREEKERRQRALEQAQKLARAEEERAAEAALRAEEAEEAADQLERRRNIALGLAAGALALALVALLFFNRAQENEQEAIAESTRAAENLATATVALVQAETERLRADGNAATATRNLATAVAAQGTAEAERTAAEEARSEAEVNAAIILSQAHARSAQEIGDENGMLALLLSVEALKAYETADAYGALHRMRAAMAKPLHAFAVPDGEVLYHTAWNSDRSEALISISGSDSTIVWDVTTGETRLVLPHDGSVVHAQWNSDESKIVTASWDGTAKVWDARNGKVLVTLKHDNGVHYATWSHDESKIVTGTDGSARVWDASTGEELFALPHEWEVFEAKWNADDSRIMTRSNDGGSSDQTSVWSAEDGELLFEVNPFEGTHYYSTEAVWSRDGSKLLTTARGGATKLWDVESGIALLTLEGGDSQAVWSSDENRILTSNDGSVIVWDAQTGEEQFRLPHNDSVHHMIWNENDERILTTSEDGTARVWDANDGEELLLMAHGSRADSAKWNADGTQILTAGSPAARVWDASSGERLLTIDEEGSSARAAWSANESRIVTAHFRGGIAVWDAHHEQALIRLSHGGRIDQAIWNEKEDRILTSSSDGNAIIWNAHSGEELQNFSHGLPISQALWNADESRVLTYGGDLETGQAMVWNAISGERLLELTHDRLVLSADWNASESRILTGGWGATARVWDAINGTTLLTLTHGPEEQVVQATWNTDGNRILTVGRNETQGSVIVWDAQSGFILQSLEHRLPVFEAVWNRDEDRILTSSGGRSPVGEAVVWDAQSGEALSFLTHDSAVWSASWNPKEDQILTSGMGSAARVWDVRNEETRLTLTHDGPVYPAIWSVDGNRILTGSEDGTTRIWDAATGREIMVLPGDDSAVRSAVWSQDESRVLISTENGNALVYNADRDELIDDACQRADRNVAWEEWKRYFAGQPYRCTCRDLPTHPSVLEAVDEGQAALAEDAMCAPAESPP